MPKETAPIPKPNPAETPEHNDSLITLATRMYWCVFGPILCVLLLISIGQKRGGWVSAADLVYLVALGLLPLSRWLEFRLGSMQTADGKPATLGDLRKYSLVVVLGGLTAWIIANVVGNYVLSP